MGNYYEGILTIPLLKNISEDLKKALIGLSYWKETIEKPKLWEKESCFQHERWDSPKMSFGFILKSGYLEYEGEPIEDETLYSKDFWNDLIGYYFQLNFCMKNYNNLGELYVEWLRPYVNTEYGYLGNIHNEDQSYNKDFFINEDIFKQEIKDREYLCKSCDKFISTCLCKNYFYCCRAYNLGKNIN